MTMQATDTRREQAAHRALARSTLYRLLSQSLSYPSEEAVAALRDVDLPEAEGEASYLPPQLRQPLAELAEVVRGSDAARLQAEHRRVFSHVITADCPPCEVLYTARHVFQETQDLSDIRAFFRAFGLELAEKERPDHISVELEFMHLLTYKEAYALLHHGAEKARLCRGVERKFVQDHLGCWAGRFAELLAKKGEGGFFGSVAALMEGFVAADVAFLRARPEVVTLPMDFQALVPEEDGCPAAESCPLVEVGSQDAR